MAVAQRPAAFADDCRRASILVASIVSPTSCSAPKAVVDFFAARREGTHALYIEDDGRVRVETVAQARGARPWSNIHAAPATTPPAKAAGSRGQTETADEPVNPDPTDRGAEPLPDDAPQ